MRKVQKLVDVFQANLDNEQLQNRPLVAKAVPSVLLECNKAFPSL